MLKSKLIVCFLIVSSIFTTETQREADNNAPTPDDEKTPKPEDIIRGEEGIPTPDNEKTVI